MPTERPPLTARLRLEPLAYLPALLALLLAGWAMPARAQGLLAASCGSGAPVRLPGPVRDCDQACHIGCNRERRGSGAF